MAENTPKLPAGLSVGPPGGAKKKAKPKAKKPTARPVGRPAPLVALHERYGLVYEPGQEVDPLVKDELDALNELYRQRAGRELADEQDTRVALEQAGFLKPTVSQKRVAGLRRGAESVFASALDALDYEKRQLSEPFYEAEAFQRPISYVAGAVSDTASDALKSWITQNVEAAAENVPKNIEAIGKVVGPPARRIARTTGVPRPEIGVSINPFDADQSRIGIDFERQTIGENIASLGRGVAAGLEAGTEQAGRLGGLALPRLYGTGLVGTPMQGAAPRVPLPTGTRPAPLDRLGARRATLKDFVQMGQEIAANPDKVIKVSSDRPAVIPGADQVLNDIAAQAKTGAVDPSQLTAQITSWYGMPERQGASEQGAESPFSPNVDKALLAFAVEEGWPAEEWGSLTPGEKMFRAYTKNEYWAILGRTLLRSFGETAAAPVALKAISDATVLSLRGNPGDAAKLLEAAIAPYPKYYDTMQKRGLWAATAEFARDNPMEAALAISLTARSASRAGGIVSRATGSQYAVAGREITARGPEAVSRPQPAPLPEVPGWQPERTGGNIFEQARAREAVERERERVAAENAERQRAWTEARTEEERRAAADISQTTVPIGVTTGRLFNDFMLQSIKQKIAERNDWFGKTYRNRLLRRKTEREQRMEANVMEGIQIEIRTIAERALSERPGKRLRRPVDMWTRERAAFNLVWDGETIGGQKLTPGLVADYFKRQSDDMRAELGDRFGERWQRDQLKYWDAQEKYFRRLDKVEIDDATMGRLREAVRPLGEQNDKIVAAVIPDGLAGAKRANRIRLMVIDPEFETRARARKRQANLAPTQLRLSQRKMRGLSEEMLKYADESGWGTAGPSRSRTRYNQVRDELVVEVRNARRLADDLNDQELVRVFDDALSRLTLARGDAMARASRVGEALQSLERLDLADDQVGRLTPDQQRAYREAQEAEAEVARLSEERAGLLAEVGLTRPNMASVRAAEKRVQDAREVLASREGMPRPNAADVEDARTKLEEAEARLERVSQAVGSTASLRMAEKSRDQKVAEAKRLIKSGETVLDTDEISAALDVSKTLAAVRIRTRKDFDYYTIERARNETIDEFIARVEAQDKNAILHLVQTRAMQNLGVVVEPPRKTRVQTDPFARARRGRLVSSQGYTFMRGLEDPNMWQNLMFDTSELISSAAWAAKTTDLLNATSLVFRFRPETLAEAKRRVDSGEAQPDEKLGLSAQQVALGDVIHAQSVELDMNQFVVVPPLSPSAKRPSTRVDEGALRLMENESLGELTIRQITERDIDPDAPGDYYLVPMAVYKAILKVTNDESFKFRPPSSPVGNLWSRSFYDKITRAWRTLTLNVFPRTAVVNITGSTILALQAGAGPQAMRYAAMAIMGIPLRMPDGTMRKLPVPPELRQRYYEQQLTNPVGAGRKLKFDDIPEPDAKDIALAWGAWYMNGIRHLNGMSEDLGRLAIWYHKAYPEAMRAAGQGPKWFASMKRLNDDAIDMLEAMARGDAEWRTKHEQWMKQSFDFLGNLHMGGEFASTLRIAIPFWQWYWHMLKLTFFTMPLKYPGRALFMQMLANIGADYQEKHGVMVPWAWGFIPFYTFDETVAGDVQKITAGADIGNIYPQFTYGQYFTRDGDWRPGKAIQDSINPLMSNTAFLLWSAIPGNAAIEFDDKKLIDAVRDEYGIEIEGGVLDSQFWNYAANRAFRMIPLSASLMSMAGRAGTAFPFPGQMPEKYKPSDALQRQFPNKDRVDLTELDSFADAMLFLAKIGIGIRWEEVEGIGPLMRQQLMRQAEEYARSKSEEDRRVAEAFKEVLGPNPTPSIEPDVPESKVVGSQ